MRAPAIIVVSTRTDANPVTAEEDLTATAAAVQNLLARRARQGPECGVEDGQDRLQRRGETFSRHRRKRSRDRVRCISAVAKEEPSGTRPRSREHDSPGVDEADQYRLTTPQ